MRWKNESRLLPCAAWLAPLRAATDSAVEGGMMKAIQVAKHNWLTEGVIWPGR